MGRAASALLVGVVAGILVGSLLTSSGYLDAASLLGVTLGSSSGASAATTVTVTSTLTVTSTVTAPPGPPLAGSGPSSGGGVAATVTVTATSTVTRTMTVGTVKTVATTRTVATTVTRTVTSLSTATRTVTVTETVTRTLTKTRTVTATKTVTLAPLLQSSAASSQPATGGYTEPPQLPRVLTVLYEGARLRVAYSEGLLFVERRLPYKDYGSVEFVFKASDGYTVYLAPFRLEDSNYVLSVYSSITPERQVLVANTSQLLEAFRGHSGPYRLYVPGTGVECAVEGLGAGAPRVECHSVIEAPPVPPPEPMEGYSTLLDALVKGAIPEASKAAEAVYGDGKPAGLVEAAWRVLEFAGEEFSYDYTKPGNPLMGVYSPSTMLEKKRGVCSDYAVFTASALLGAGYDAYVLVLDTPSGGHAAAAVALNGVFYVLDQHPPPVELQDYLEYIATSTRPPMIVYHLHSGGVEEWLLDPARVTDSYPEDRLEDGVVGEARSLVAKATGMEPVESLATVIDCAETYASYTLYLPTLGGLGASSGEKPLDLVYSPVFRVQWARMLANYSLRLLEKYYAGEVEARGGFWAETRRDRGLVLVVYAAKERVRAAHHVADGVLVVEAWNLPAGLDPVNDVNLLAYTKNSKEPCAGVTPPGYVYKRIPYVEADRWSIEKGRLVIEVRLAELENAVKSCRGDVFLALWIRDNIVYALKLR